MRPLIAILLSSALFAGVYGYTSFVAHVRIPPLEIVPEFSSGQYSLHITRTFDCVGDPDFDVDALLVKFRGAVVYSRSDTIPRDEKIEIRPLENVEQRSNEIFVSANVGLDDGDWGESELGSSDAMRVEVFAGDTAIADKTFWLEPGAETISGTISFETRVESTDHTDSEH